MTDADLYYEPAPLTIEDIRSRATLTIEEAGQVLGIGRWAAYRAANRGEIPTLTLGRRKVCPVPALLRMLGDDGHTVAFDYADNRALRALKADLGIGD